MSKSEGSSAAGDGFGLAVVVPFRNEEAGLEEAVGRQAAALAELDLPTQIVIVDDASSDASPQVARALTVVTPAIKVVTNARNLGIAGAFVEGARAATLSHVILVPVDNPLGADVLRSFLQEAGPGRVVVGWRSGRPGYTPFRRALSVVYAVALRWMTGLRLRDLTWICLYDRSLLLDVKLRSTRIAGLPELLVHAARKGSTFGEVPCPAVARRTGRATSGRLSVVLRTGVETLRLALAALLPPRDAP